MGMPINGVPVRYFVLWSVHFAGHYGFRRCLRHRVQLVLRFRRPEHQSVNSSPGPRQLPFGPSAWLVSGQLYEPTAEGSGNNGPLSCRLSATGIRFLDHPSPAGEFGLPHGRLTGRSRTPTGLSRSTQPRPDREGCSLYPEARCSHGRHLVTGRRCRFPAASPTPQHHIHLRGLQLRGINKNSLPLTRPVFPLPVTPGWNGRPWAFPLMLRTPPLPATHVRAGTDHEH